MNAFMISRSRPLRGQMFLNRWHGARIGSPSRSSEESMSIQRMTTRVVSSWGIALALTLASSPWHLVSAAGKDDHSVKFSGCLVRGEGDGDPYLLTNSPTDPALVASSSSVTPSGVGTSAEFRNVFYWLYGDGSLKEHVGHLVEIEGDLKGDVKDGEIKLDRKDHWTELSVKSDGRSMKAQVPNTSVVAPSKGHDAKASVAVRRVDVEHVRMLAASCEP
jgi:hypothetical protein